MTIIPTVSPPKSIKVPSVSDRTLDNGLRVLVARRPGVPRFEARLHIQSPQRASDDGSRRRVLANALMGGTAERSSLDLARELQRLGASLDTSTDADEVVVHGSALSAHLPAFLGLLAEVVTGATFPTEEVLLERDRVAQEILLARSQPTTIAREAFVRRIYGEHPYGRGLPEPDAVQKTSANGLRNYHRTRIRPDGAVLVIVGDVRADAVIKRASEAFATWASAGAPAMVAAPRPQPGGPTIIVHRKGAVQTNVRIGGPAVKRGHPDHPALTLANLVFGGYFSSRLVDNIRERRGYTYGPGSVIQQHRRAAHIVVVADVGTEVTAPALVETRYELGRMASTLATDDELEAAKRYLAGTIALSTQTQAGLASYLGSLAADGLAVDYLRDLPRAVQKLGAADVQEAAWHYLAPRGLATVLVGDADAIQGPMSAFDDVEVVDDV